MNNFENASPATKLAMIIEQTAQMKILKKAVFSKSVDASIVRMVATLRKIGGADVLQCEYFHKDNKATHKNLTIDYALIFELEQIISAFSQINIITTGESCEYRRSKSGKETIIGEQKLVQTLEGNDIKTVNIIGNDRKKEYILDGKEPFLKLLGVSDMNGRIYDKKRSKFKQINRFLEMIRDVEDNLPKDKIVICDLCCGKSYLSFAVYHYFASVKGYDVAMYGADLKSDVIEYCAGVAEKLSFDGLKFLCTDIKKFTVVDKPDLVISLHACDTATDIVLDKAMEWDARVILSTPCCHHELNRTLNCPALSFISDYSMLKQKLCDAATDALRLKLLEANGYSCEALELIDPEETPKNIMLRAIKRPNFSSKSPRAKQAMDEYNTARKFLLGE